MTDTSGYKAPCEKPHEFRPWTPNLIYWGDFAYKHVDQKICIYMGCGASRANPVHHV